MPSERRYQERRPADQRPGGAEQRDPIPGERPATGVTLLFPQAGEQEEREQRDREHATQESERPADDGVRKELEVQGRENRPGHDREDARVHHRPAR